MEQNVNNNGCRFISLSTLMMQITSLIPLPARSKNNSENEQLKSNLDTLQTQCNKLVGENDELQAKVNEAELVLIE